MTYVVISPSKSVVFSCNDAWHGVSDNPGISYTFRDATFGKSCPAKLSILASTFVGYVLTASVDFAGRGKVGGECGGSDQYVEFDSITSGGATYVMIYVDVWKAYRDNVWTSSTTIKLYRTQTGIGDLGFQMVPVGSASSVVSFAANLPPDAAGSCPPSLAKTITVFDDKTFSAA